MAATTTESDPQRILILDNGPSASSGIAAKVSASLPETEIRHANSLDDYFEALRSTEFDIVVLDYDLPAARDFKLLAQLKVRDHEPDVLLVSKCDQAEIVRSIAQSRKRYVVRDEGWIDSVVVALRDMVRIRRLEYEMSIVKERLTIANARLEERNRRLDDFCATIAHDIRGPLAGLILKTEYIIDQYQGSLDPRCATLLKRSADSAHRLVGVVQGMYEFAKIGAGVMRFEQVELAQLISEVLGDLNIDEAVEVQVGVADLPQVWGSPNLLRRVFINLISNAIKFNDKQDVRLNIGYAGEATQDGVRFARLYVEDNGPGIAPNEASGIFTMFTRGRCHRGSTEGLGIGLAVVQRIVELHQGLVELQSTPAQGCRFSFLVPLEKPPLPQVQANCQGELDASKPIDSLPHPLNDNGPIKHIIGRV
jgi:signal transduction histidine kinase